MTKAIRARDVEIGDKLDGGVVIDVQKGIYVVTITFSDGGRRILSVGDSVTVTR